MRKLAFLIIPLILILALHSLCSAQENKTLVGIDILTGFGWGKLRAQDNYKLTPLSVAFSFDLKPLVQKIKLNPKSLIHLQVEPFLNTVNDPRSNLETGASFWLKLGLLGEESKLQPYFKIGAGLLYMTQHTREQATQFNFTEQIGVGTHYYFSKNTALTLEGRWRHLSNAGIKHPNQGINTYFVLTGISYKF